MVPSKYLVVLFLGVVLVLSASITLADRDDGYDRGHDRDHDDRGHDRDHDHDGRGHGHDGEKPPHHPSTLEGSLSGGELEKPALDPHGDHHEDARPGHYDPPRQDDHPGLGHDDGHNSDDRRDGLDPDHKEPPRHEHGPGNGHDDHPGYDDRSGHGDHHPGHPDRVVESSKSLNKASRKVKASPATN